MKYLNERLRNSQRLLSEPWRSATFGPNYYLADSLKDFNQNRFSIKGTPWYAYEAGKELTGVAGVIVPVSRYRETQKGTEKFDETISQLGEPNPHSLRRIRESLNAELYDDETVVPILSDFTFPKGTMIKPAFIQYNPVLDLAILIPLETKQPPTRGGKKLTLIDMLEKFFPLPEPSPT